MAKRILPSQDYLKQLFDYDPTTGELTWKRRPREHFVSDRGEATWNARFPHHVAGVFHNATGYVFITINDRKFKAHRIIWKLVTGQEPTDEIDHRNLNRADNRWNNLRQATRVQNLHNTPARRHITSGIKGVYFDARRGYFYTRIQVNKRGIFLGCFPTAEKAKQAYDAAARLHFGEFARLK